MLDAFTIDYTTKDREQSFQDRQIKTTGPQKSSNFSWCNREPIKTPNCCFLLLPQPGREAAPLSAFQATFTFWFLYNHRGPAMGHSCEIHHRRPEYNILFQLSETQATAARPPFAYVVPGRSLWRRIFWSSDKALWCSPLLIPGVKKYSGSRKQRQPPTPQPHFNVETFCLSARLLTFRLFGLKDWSFVDSPMNILDFILFIRGIELLVTRLTVYLKCHSSERFLTGSREVQWQINITRILIWGIL